MTAENKQRSITTHHYSYLFTDHPVIDMFESTEGSRMWTIVDNSEVSEFTKDKGLWTVVSPDEEA